MRFVALAALASCASHAPASRVEILPIPAVASDDAATNEPLDDLACKPEAMTAVDVEHLEGALASARDFAQRCCNGDESGDANVHVTVSPDGFKTEVAIDPERLATGATGACVYATFHRIIVKSYDGAERAASIVVHLR